MPGRAGVGQTDFSHSTYLHQYTNLHQLFTAKSSDTAILFLHCHHPLLLFLMINAYITLRPLVLIWGMKLCAVAVHTKRVLHVGKVKQMSTLLWLFKKMQQVITKYHFILHVVTNEDNRAPDNKSLWETSGSFWCFLTDSTCQRWREHQNRWGISRN